ncbi:MAG: acyl-CoA synthetase [Alphaproteobacteria bacterium]|nr:acyl-CoA synthetase [Alphaproteobacteria bacterium]
MSGNCRTTASKTDLLDRFRPLFEPRAYAVVGASTSKVTLGNEMLHHLRSMDFDGTVYPIHPKADEVEGLKAYPSLGETPEPIDFAYIVVAASQVPKTLAAAKGRVKFALVVSSGFGEREESKGLQEELLRAANEAGVRVVGPNCLGTYCPAGRVTFIAGSAKDSGPVGVISQSGGLGVDIIRRGSIRGIRFSRLITVGNSADLGASDILEFYAADPETKVIGMYAEGISDGRRFFQILRDLNGAKPVVLMKGGRTEQGQRAAASHTGSLASDERVWLALAEQTGLVLVDTLEEFLDTLLAFQYLTPRTDHPTRDVVMFGNGGGTSVLATDFFARTGLEVPRFADETVRRLEEMNFPPGTSIDNPIDAPGGTMRVDDGRVAGRIVDAVYASGTPDAFVMHINLPVFQVSYDQGADYTGHLVESALEAQHRASGHTHFALVLRSDGSIEVEERKIADRRNAQALGVPVFDELPNVAGALAALRHYERFLQKHR